MKTSIKYIDTTTRAGLNLANRLIWQGWKVASTGTYGVTFYKIYSK
jgi:hypothetical protein